jgi:ubiquinone/menaquinone biosynthesis C-methylase UbiE
MAGRPDLKEQEKFWDREAGCFDAIYSHQKSRLGVWLDRTFRWDMYERFRYTLREAEPIPGRTFLDVGCGTGMYALELARRQAREVVGLDISGTMVEICRKRALEEQLADQTKFFQTNLLDFHPLQSFDLCIGIGLMDYIAEPLPVLAKMRRLTRDRTILSFPMKGTWRAVLRQIRLNLKKCRVYFYSRSDVEWLLREAGFARYSLKEHGQLLCVTAYVA